MPAELETMMYCGETPWHGDGVYVGDEPVKSDIARVKSGLTWRAEKKRCFAATGAKSEGGKLIEIPDLYAVVRDSDNAILGTVGKTFKILQPEDSFTLLDSLVDTGEVRYHTAGSLKGGRIIWLLAKVGSFEVVNGDVIDKFIALFNAFDGSMMLRLIDTDVRVVCANTMQAALSEAIGTGIAVKHTKNMEKRVRDARMALEVVRKSMEQETELFRRMAGVRFSDAAFDEFALDLIPNPTGENAILTKAENQRAKLRELFEAGVGQDIPGVRGTVWAAMNAVTEYANFHRPTRGDDAQAKRFESTMFGASRNLITQAQQNLIQVVQAAA